MAASLAASGFFRMSSTKSSPKLVGGPNSLDIQGISPKPRASSSRGLQVKANAHIVTETKDVRVEDDGPNSGVPRIFYNKLLSNAFVLGEIVENGPFYRQNFSIRSYEIGVDRTASIETLLNYLQESGINHVKCAGMLGDGLGSTPMMNQRNLIWVTAKMQVSVEHYPCWEDVVEVDTWLSPSGKNGVCRYWIVRDCQTRQTIMKATSTCVMMNEHTRRFSKIPEDIREESKHLLSQSCTVIMDEESRKLTKLNVDTADYVCSGLIPRRGDLDMNQHVNNVKYIGWVLESTPTSILESHELASMTLEFRKECRRDSVLQSLTATSTNSINGSQAADIKCQHLLQLESGAEVVRGQTEWRPKLQQT